MVDLISGFIGLCALVLSIYNTWRQQHVLGPQFNLTEACIDDYQFNDQETELVSVKILIQNIGDRMGFMRWEKIRIEVRDRVFIAHTTQKPWEWQAQSDIQTPKRITFIMPIDFDLTNGVFIAEGVYTSHKGRMLPLKHRTPLTGVFKSFSEGFT